MSRTVTVLLWLVLLSIPFHSVLAQTATADATFVYGVSGGPAERTVSGRLSAAALPAGAEPPSTDRLVSALGLQAGRRINRHAAALVVWDQAFGGNRGPARWGTSELHAVGRVWLGRVWAQAGGGLSHLGYKATTGPGIDVHRLWAPGAQAAVGVDLLRGRRVALVVSGRFTRATFEGLTVSRLGFEVGLFGRP